mmetsp:Transcript_23644/g.55056  ORF Transcript_23644/g.55056 Transcript_23644/m.55056 type:complete len:175 (-) Transcript_23644:221-745(-)
MEKGECSGCHGSILRKNIEKKQTHPLKKPLVFLRYQTFRSFMYTIMGNHKEKGSPQNQNDSTSLTTKYTETTPKECFTPSRQNDLSLVNCGCMGPGIPSEKRSSFADSCCVPLCAPGEQSRCGLLTNLGGSTIPNNTTQTMQARNGEGMMMMMMMYRNCSCLVFHEQSWSHWYG